MVEVEVTMQEANGILPSCAHVGDAGFDLRASIGATLAPFERMVVPCGFSMALPEGFAGLVVPRSGLAARHGVSVVNAPGLIDSGYRGEIKVVLANTDPHESFSFNKGDRIAQLMIIAVPSVRLKESAQLSATERGSCGFGSSGVE